MIAGLVEPVPFKAVNRGNHLAPSLPDLGDFMPMPTSRIQMGNSRIREVANNGTSIPAMGQINKPVGPSAGNVDVRLPSSVVGQR